MTTTPQYRCDNRIDNWRIWRKHPHVADHEICIANNMTEDEAHDCVETLNAKSTLFHLTNLTLTAAGRGNYAVPDFCVHAIDADKAIGEASRIVLCDRRTTDGILWKFAGQIGRTWFRIEMKV